MEPKNNGNFFQSNMFKIALGVLSLFLIVEIVSVIDNLGKSDLVTNTITVEGKGEEFAIPDVAIFSVTVTKEAKTVLEAQKLMSDKMNVIIAEVKKAGVAEKDIKTENYYVNPKYDYTSSACIQGYCPPTKPVFIGYEVSQSIQVKIREVVKAGDILSTVGGLGATSIGNLNFTVDDQDTIKDKARNLAIANAKTKADELAKQLGVKLVRVVSFSENGGNYPMYDKAMMSSSVSAPAVSRGVDLPQGETKIVSNVNITYEIK
ncbi:MAG: SIMPL domain-containing protein [bacterium]|nr:SIMPL domain-containing protein [bacterium]